MPRLSRADAIKFLGLSEKIFDNYSKQAQEFPCLERSGRHGRFYFDQEVLEDWRHNYQWRTVELTLDDYAQCLDFALAKHFQQYVTSDFGTGRQREFGQKITNWVKGQLGEIAVQRFLESKFGTRVELDFEIRPDIVFQDITGVIDGGRVREPRIGVGIKSSKPKNAYLILSENEIGIDDRRSDVYIYCRPDIPDDHLLLLARERVQGFVCDKQHFATYRDQMADLNNIPCEVVGWCDFNELERVTSIEGQVFDGSRWVRKSGLLRRSEADWQEFIQRL